MRSLGYMFAPFLSFTFLSEAAGFASGDLSMVENEFH